MMPFKSRPSEDTEDRADGRPRRADGRPRRVLVVDDEANIRLTLTEMLEAMGIEAVAVTSGREALAALTSRDGSPFDLVLLDLRMPGMGGMEVLRDAAVRVPGVPFVVVTAHGDVETAVEAMQAGAAGFVEKPFTPAEIRAVVQSHLGTEPEAREAARFADHVGHAREAIGERRLEAALEHARMAVALRPARPEPFNLMGVVMQLRMDVAEAQRYFRSALALDDTYEPARQNLENLSGFPKRLSQFLLD